MKYVIILFLLFAKCSTKSDLVIKPLESIISKEADSNKYKKYPKRITELGLENWFDEAKWVLYCINCGEVCKFYKEFRIKDTILLSSLSLKLDTIIQFNDSTVFICRLYKLFNVFTLTQSFRFTINRSHTKTNTQ